MKYFIIRLVTRPSVPLDRPTMPSISVSRFVYDRTATKGRSVAQLLERSVKQIWSVASAPNKEILLAALYPKSIVY